jgi:glutaredoxin
MPQPKVTLYHAAGCHLCERARGTVREVRKTAPFELEEVDIAGDPRLEAKYREWLPVVEINGERAFVYYVDPAALQRKLGAQS